MALLRNGRFRLPVLGRLTWAWAAFAAGAAVFSSYAFLTGDDHGAIARIELPIAPGIERLAPPIAGARMIANTSPDKRDGLRILKTAAGVTLAAAPSLRETGPAIEPFSLEADYESLLRDEKLANIVEPGAMIGDVVITIDGAPARSPAEIALAASAPPVRVTLDYKIPAPDRSLLRSSAYGKIPRPSADGRKAATYYARAHKKRAKIPTISLVVGGLGLNRALTERAIDDLPPEITLAFAPYAKDLDFWTRKAREAGHEIMIELPMENRSGPQEDLGPAALLTTRTAAENMQRLDWLLARFGGYFGATNYLGSKFSSDPAAMRAVLDRLKQAGVAYLDDTGAVGRYERKQAADFAVVNRIVAASRGGAISSDLEALEKIARRDGDALGKTYALSESIGEIVHWSDGLEARGIALAPASAVLHDRNAAG